MIEQVISVGYSQESLRIDYLDSRLSILQIAIKYGLSYRAIHKALVRFGIPRWPRGAVRNQTRERNPNWRGNAATYFGLHKRLRRDKGTPNYCSDCKTTDPTKRYEWSNLSGNYADPNDYVRRCKSCHTKADGLIGNLRGTPPPRVSP